MPSTPEDTSEAHGYAIAKLEDGKEIFFEKNGISYGRGKVWNISPEDRVWMELELPVGDRALHDRDMSARYPSTKAKERKVRELHSDEFFALHSPEWLARLQSLLAEVGPAEMPDDATVARSHIHTDVEAFFNREPEKPFSERYLCVLVLSNTYDEIGEAQRHPDLEWEVSAAKLTERLLDRKFKAHVLGRLRTLTVSGVCPSEGGLALLGRDSKDMKHHVPMRECTLVPV